MISREAAHSFQRLRLERQQVLKYLSERQNVYEVQGNMVYDCRDPNTMLSLSLVEQHIVQQVQQTEGLVSDGQYLAALKILHECQLLADCYLSCDREMQPWLMIYLLSNMGVCFHHFSLLDEAYSCYESAQEKLRDYLWEPEKELKKAGSLTDLSKWMSLVPNSNISLKLQLIRLRIAMGTIFSCIEKKQEAFKYYRKATSLCLNIIVDLVEPQKQIHSSKTLSRQQRLIRSQSPKTTHDLLTTQHSLNSLKKYKNPLKPILLLLNCTIQDITPLFPKINKRTNRRQIIKQRIELPTAKINEFFQINPHDLTLQQLSHPKILKYSQFSHSQPDLSNIMQLIIMTSLALYYMAYCHPDKHQYQSQLLMNKSIEICYTYLPVSTPFVKQMIRSYNVCFGVQKQTIPQYGQAVHTVKFIRSSLNKNQIGKLFVPCIRNIKVLRYDEDDDEKTKRKLKFKREVTKNKMTRETQREPPRQSKLLQKIINLMELQGILHKSKPKMVNPIKPSKKTPMSGRSTSDQEHPSAAIARQKRA